MDTRYQNIGIDNRFPSPGRDTRFDGAGLSPGSLVVVEGGAQGADIATFTRTGAVSPGAISIIAQTPAGAFQMNADGATLEYGATPLDSYQAQFASLTLGFSDLLGGPYTFDYLIPIVRTNAPVGGPFALQFDVPGVTPPVDATAPTVTLGVPTVTTTTASIPVSTDEGNGTIYWKHDAAASLTPAQIKAAPSGTIPVGSAGAQTPIDLIGLAPSSTSNVHVCHEDLAGNMQPTAQVATYTTDAAAAGLSGVNTPVTIINDTGNKAPYSGTVAVVAGRKLIVHAYAWTATGGQNPTTEWTATFDGAAITPIAQTFNAGTNMAGAVYEIDIAATGTKTLAITLGAAGRGLFAHGWPDLEGFGTPAVQSSGSNSAYPSDVTSLTVPTAFTPAQNGNAILSSAMIRGAGQAASVTVAGADGYLAADTGANATSDFTAVRAWGVIDPAAATTFTYNWTTAARACGLRTEIRKGP